jgi:hypothetical protein
LYEYVLLIFLLCFRACDSAGISNADRRGRFYLPLFLHIALFWWLFAGYSARFYLIRMFAGLFGFFAPPGFPGRQAGRHLSISRRTFNRWMQEGFF